MVTIERDTARFRRSVPGYVPGQGRCHSQIELSADGEFVLLHLASVSWFSIALDRPAALRLLHLLDAPEADRIPVWQDDGERWLAIRPHEERSALPAVLRRDGPAVELVAVRATPGPPARLPRAGTARSAPRPHRRLSPAGVAVTVPPLPGTYWTYYTDQAGKRAVLTIEIVRGSDFSCRPPNSACCRRTWTAS